MNDVKKKQIIKNSLNYNISTNPSRQPFYVIAWSVIAYKNSVYLLIHPSIVISEVRVTDIADPAGHHQIIMFTAKGEDPIS